MRINYKGRTFELAELKEPNSNQTFDIIAIFEIKPYKWTEIFEYPECVECSEEEEDAFEKLFFIEYFYGASLDSDEELTTTAMRHIDRYDRQR